jgi:hypothetical protein
MRLQSMKILAGTALSLTISAIAITPAIATPVVELAQTPTQINNSRTYKGIVRSIIGNVVSVRLDNGEVREIGMCKLDQGRIGLVPGRRVIVDDEGWTPEVAIAPWVDPVIVARTATRIETTERTERRRIELPPPQERPAPVRPAPVEPAPVQVEPVQEVEQPRRPIRALW